MHNWLRSSTHSQSLATCTIGFLRGWVGETAVAGKDCSLHDRLSLSCSRFLEQLASSSQISPVLSAILRRNTNVFATHYPFSKDALNEFELVWATPSSTAGHSSCNRNWVMHAWFGPGVLRPASRQGTGNCNDQSYIESCKYNTKLRSLISNFTELASWKGGWARGKGKLTLRKRGQEEGAYISVARLPGAAVLTNTFRVLPVNLP